jgi:hypothetical protein
MSDIQPLFTAFGAGTRVVEVVVMHVSVVARRLGLLALALPLALLAERAADVAPVAGPAGPGGLEAAAHAGGVERRVRDLVEAGEIVPFELVRSRVASQVRGTYLGVEFDEPTLTYRFRFLVDGEVINVDVDARTGQRRRQQSRAY